jgi:hypothetical protein
MQAAADAAPGDPRALGGVAEIQASLGSLCRAQRRFDESLARYREALRARERAAAAPTAPPGADGALAAARTDVARVLLDLVEVREPGPATAARLREAGALLAQAAPAGQEAAAEKERQAVRWRRLTSAQQ